MSPQYYHRKPPPAEDVPPGSSPSPPVSRAAATSPAGTLSRRLAEAPPAAADPPPRPPPQAPPPAPARPAPAPTPSEPKQTPPTRDAAEPPLEPDPAAEGSANAEPPEPTKTRTATPTPLHALHWVALATIIAAGLWLRLRDPLSSAIIGAEDPYLHMERTWNLVQGRPLADYPPGLMILLFPFAFLGPDTFYQVVRFGPALVGAGAVAATFFLCRPYMHPIGALTAGAIVATMSEHIFRTNILMPTALDLLLVPVFLLATLRASEGIRWGLPVSIGLGVYFALVHPWALALVLVPVGLYWLVMLVTRRERRRWAVPAAAGGIIGFAALVSLLPVWNPVQLVVGHAVPRLVQLASEPGGFLPLPPYVDFPHMLGWPALLLGAVGAIVAARHRSRFALLALLWSGLLLPLILVDWFDIWYIPHRTVAYFAIGIAMLSGLAASEAVRAVLEARPHLRRTLPAAVLAVVLLASLPGAMATQPWYRLYDENDVAAWDALEARGTTFVMAGGWQVRAGYRAATGGAADYNPEFFRDDVVRQFELRKRPDLVVVVDNVTAQMDLPTGFLASWTLVGQWGDVRAFTHQGNGS